MIEYGERYFELKSRMRLIERTGCWETLGPDALRVRDDVFIKEQHVPPEIERDEFDETAIHIVLYTQESGRDEQAIATGRVVAQSCGEALSGPVGRIGRLAVQRAFRGLGLGQHLLITLISKARANGLTQFELHSRVDAMPIYERHGFIASGESFDEAGTPHILMMKSDPSKDSDVRSFIAE